MTSEQEHRAAVEAWRRQRYAALRRETGWLTLAGLSWLRPGINRIGTDPDGEIVLPSGPASAGTVTLDEERIVADGLFTHGGAPADGLTLETDADGEPTMLELGALRLCAIERGGRFAIRTWDTDAPGRREFHGIPHWPVDPAWRLTARFDATPGRMLRVPDVLGTVDEEASPGDLVFEMEGEWHRLQALPGGEAGELWLVFADATNGNETYGGGRFLYSGEPSAGGTVELDFNRAYNPPCVFSPYATCPLPWPENRLRIRIEAGERAYKGHG
jgi:uncharacterized protein (DUF1684 family)